MARSNSYSRENGLAYDEMSKPVRSKFINKPEFASRFTNHASSKMYNTICVLSTHIRKKRQELVLRDLSEVSAAGLIHKRPLNRPSLSSGYLTRYPASGLMHQKRPLNLQTLSWRHTWHCSLLI